MHVVQLSLVSAVCPAVKVCLSVQMLEFGRAALYNQSFVLESACRVQREVC